MVGLIVEDHDAAMGGDAGAEGRARVEGRAAGDGRAGPGVGFGLGLLAALLWAVDVGEVEGAAGGGAAGFVLEDDGEVPVTAPFGWYQRVGVEDAGVGEIFLEPFVDGEVGGDDD